MTTTTLERTEGLSVLNQAMAAIKEKIEEKRGVFNIQMEVYDIHSAQIWFLVFKISTVQHMSLEVCSNANSVLEKAFFPIKFDGDNV